MAAEILEIKISSDVRSALEGIGQVTNSLLKVSAPAKSAQTSLEMLTPPSERIAQIFNDFRAEKFASGLEIVSKNSLRASKATKTFGTELDKAKLSTNQSTMALMNFGRIAQDAPFGLMGITNNLNPMLESFQRLKQTTGSTGSALKAMVGSLTGAAGVGVALSVVSSLLLVFGKELFGSKTAAEENTEALDALNDKLKESKAAFEALETSISNANKIGRVNLDIAFGKGSEADLLALQAQVNDVNTEIFKLENNINDLIDEKIAIEVDLDAEGVTERLAAIQTESDGYYKKLDQKEADRTLLFRQQAQIRTNIERDALKEAQDAANERNKAFQKMLADRNKMMAEFAAKFKAIKFENFKTFIDFSKLPKDFAAATKIIKDQLGDIFQPMETAFLLSGKKAGVLYGEELTKAIEAELNKKNKFVDALEKGGLKDARVKIEAQIVMPRRSSFADLLEGMKTIELKADGTTALRDITNEAKVAAETINEVLTPAFDNMFESILEGEDPLKAFFNGIMESIAMVIKKLIQAAIQAAILSAISGGTSSFGSQFKSLMGLGGGGVSAPGSIMGGSRAALSVNVNGRISGSSLNLVGARTMQRQSLFG